MAPFYLLCTIPYGKFRETWIFASRATNPECRPADLLFFLLFTIYYLERKARFFCIAGSRPRRTARMAPLLFTLYYSLWKISRNLDSLHRGPPTLNVGQQIYCFFTISYFLFRTESEFFFASRAADPEERPKWHPFCLLCTIPYGKFPKPGFFASRATNPECRPADLLFFTIYYLLFRTESENSLHRGQPTQKNGQNGPFCLLCTIPYGKSPETEIFCIAGHPTLNVGQQIYCFLLFTIYYLERRARIPCIAGS